jgi:hypothetical protein
MSNRLAMKEPPVIQKMSRKKVEWILNFLREIKCQMFCDVLFPFHFFAEIQ